MRVFVTGATGFIGEAVVAELIAAGHSVLGLARSDASAEALARKGIAAHRGELTDLDSLRAGARASEAVIHLAFIHDFSVYQAAIETDRVAVEAMLAEAKTFIGVTGSATLPSGRLATERDAPGGHARGVTEGVVVDAAKRGVRSMVVRLAPSVHGAGDKGFVPMMIAAARRDGFAGYLGDGSNRWPAMHRSDAGTLFRLALERGQPAARLHGVAEQGIEVRAIASVIGEALGMPTRSLSVEEARAHFGWLAAFAGVDNPTANAITREALGWTPTGPELLADMRAHYF
ncbi:MAG: SDR family oxidoreductase [Polyangiales bacterium]